MWNLFRKEGVFIYRFYLLDEIENEVQVGTLDTINVDYIALHYNDSTGSRSVEQYFFTDNQPSLFSYNQMNTNCWPLNKPPLNQEIKKVLIGLCWHAPKIKDSLEKCIQELQKPGRLYPFHKIKK